MNDKEWLEDWRQRSRGVDVLPVPKASGPEHDKRREAWDSVRYSLRIRYGDYLLGLLPLKQERING